MQQIPNQHSIRLSGRDLHSTEISFVRIHHRGGVSRDGKTKINEISLCFWMDINHTSHSLAFLSLFCVGGTVGTGAQVPQTAPPYLGLKGRVG